MTGLILEYLAALVACDTQNPPRQITPRHPLYAFLESVCDRDFQIEVVDHGQGRVSWFARRGSPRILFNVHLDTVPATAAWSGDPLKLVVADNRAVGLGACDIKGAAACLLALARQSDADLGLLFTTDEEGSNPCCVHKFTETYAGEPRLIVVAEPTCARVVFGHRGYLSQRGTFSGQAGHTSLPKELRHSAVHQLVNWSTAALRHVADAERLAGPGIDFCFNLGTVSGGVKNNVIADQAEVRWSARLPPGQDGVALRSQLAALASGPQANWETTFSGPAFPSTIQLREKAQQCLAPLSLPMGMDVDFWTEASLFSQRDWPAVVLGPGDIAQAHSPGEWVALDQLQQTYEHYSRIAHVD